MSATSGNVINLSDLDNLYLRIYNLRNTHYNSDYQLNASNIASAQQSSGLSQGSKIEVATAKIDLLKQELKNLANSQWYQSNTAGTIVSMTDFSNNFSIPNIGDLLEASDFNLIENTITTAESIVPQYSNKYNSRYDSQYTSRYGTCYGSRYDSQYTSRYGSRYGTCYGTCYGSRYGTCYGGRYGTCYSGRYGTCYSGCYRGKYTTQYRSRYSAKYSYRTAFNV